MRCKIVKLKDCTRDIDIVLKQMVSDKLCVTVTRNGQNFAVRRTSLKNAECATDIKIIIAQMI